MQPILDFFADNLWVPVLAALALAGRRLVERLVERGVDQRFDRRLEEHKHALQLTTERARHQYQLELADFNLYAVKRHEAAAAIYAAARKAHGSVANLVGGREGLTFEEYDRDDIDEYMRDCEVPGGKRREILDLWDDDPDQAIARLRPYLRVLEIQRAERDYHELRNTTYLNELYLTDEAIGALDALIASLTDWLGHIKFPVPEERWRPDRDGLNAALERVHTVLRRELSQGRSLSEVIGSGGVAEQVPGGAHLLPDGEAE